jgi:hypothetical protein
MSEGICVDLWDIIAVGGGFLKGEVERDLPRVQDWYNCVMAVLLAPRLKSGSGPGRDKISRHVDRREVE